MEIVFSGVRAHFVSIQRMNVGFSLSLLFTFSVLYKSVLKGSNCKSILDQVILKLGRA